VLFWLIKLYARFCLQIYCRRLVLNKRDYLHATGPILFAANHPNSFLDGIILTILLEENLYSLARGDAFKNNSINKLLRWIHLLPVYRTSEGIENLSHNYTTFESCHQVFAGKGMVIIFSEGRCINEWHLRPLLKGTARLAISTWQKGIDLTVIPVGFNYHTFRNFGKNIIVNFGSPISKKTILSDHSDGRQLIHFNEQLNAQLQTLVYEIDKNDAQKLEEKFYKPISLFRKIALAIPALSGFIMHAPLYYSIKLITFRNFDNDHFDSVVVSLLMLCYPLYLLLLTVIAYLIFGAEWAFATFILLPFTAWTCVQLKPQFDS
jgi:1-acyl-sn-glycerol-3-phosphate acyltransferase